HRDCRRQHGSAAERSKSVVPAQGRDPFVADWRRRRSSQWPGVGTRTCDDYRYVPLWRVTADSHDEDRRHRWSSERRDAVLGARGPCRWPCRISWAGDSAAGRTAAYCVDCCAERAYRPRGVQRILRTRESRWRVYPARTYRRALPQPDEPAWWVENARR